MGTNLLRIVPIHSKQPKPFLVPDYGYYGWLDQFLRIDVCPSLSDLDFYILIQIVVHSTFPVCFRGRSVCQFYVRFLAVSSVSTSISRFNPVVAVQCVTCAETFSLLPDQLNLERTSGFSSR